MRSTVSLTSDDEDKPVVAVDGTEVGTVTQIDGETVYVALDDGVEVNWGETEDGTYALGENTIESVDEGEVRLRGEL